MRIVVSEFITLDGVMEAPQNWSFDFQTDDTAKFKHDEIFASDALLIGEVTYQEFAKSWPARTGDFADRMNSVPKYVVSTNLKELTWNNAHLIGQNVVDEIAKLKAQPGQDLLVAGSGMLVQTLMENGFVDEYRFLVHPIVLGTGKHFFKEGEQAKLKLIEAKSYDSGMVLLRYQPKNNELNNEEE